jgi:hypothetical protein
MSSRSGRSGTAKFVLWKSYLRGRAQASAGGRRESRFGLNAGTHKTGRRKGQGRCSDALLYLVCCALAAPNIHNSWQYLPATTPGNTLLFVHDHPPCVGSVVFEHKIEDVTRLVTRQRNDHLALAVPPSTHRPGGITSQGRRQVGQQLIW